MASTLPAPLASRLAPLLLSLLLLASPQGAFVRPARAQDAFAGVLEAVHGARQEAEAKAAAESGGGTSPEGEAAAPSPKLERQDAKKWKGHAFEETAKAVERRVHRFLHAGHRAHVKDDFVAPIEITVILLGFEGTGAYGVDLDAKELETFLGKVLSKHCPSVLKTGERLMACHKVVYEVISSDDGLDAYEQAVKLEMDLTHLTAEDDLTPPTDAIPTPKVPVYSAEASNLVELALHKIVDKLYEGNEGDGVMTPFAHHTWHQDNVIVVVNPRKWKMVPTNNEENMLTVNLGPRNSRKGNNAHQRAMATDIRRRANEATLVGFARSWDSGHLSMMDIGDQEASFQYRYAYKGRGASATWLSSGGILVVDLSAGPCNYGPEISASGAVTHVSVPRFQDIFRANGELLGLLEGDERESDVVFADAKRHRNSLLLGSLGSVIASGARHVFMPDIAQTDLATAPALMVPVVFLRDHSDDPIHPGDEPVVSVQDVSRAVQELTGTHGVVRFGVHDLHRHRHLAVAVERAMQTSSEAVLVQGDHAGMHPTHRTYLDSDLLLEAFSEAADELTSWLLPPQHKDLQKPRTGGKPGAEEPEEGHSRILPVYVLSLTNVPPNLTFDNREVVVASADAVLVLRAMPDLSDDLGAAQAAATGHLQDGNPVLVPLANMTRHVVAGMAQALGGIAPPYMAYDALHEAPSENWIWATGAQPFGPYSSYSHLGALSGLANRNRLLLAAHNNLVRIRATTDLLNDFIAEYMRSPFGKPLDSLLELRRSDSWVDRLYASTDPGAALPLPWEVASQIETYITASEGLWIALAKHAYHKDWTSAQQSAERLSIVTRRLEHYGLVKLQKARDDMSCCHVEYRSREHDSTFSYLKWFSGFCVVTGALLLLFYAVYVRSR